MLMKNKKVVFISIIMITMCIIACFVYSHYNNNNYNTYLIDKEDYVYLLTGIDKKIEFCIETSKDKEYSITDVQGNIVESNSRYENGNLFISPKDSLKDENTYLLCIQDGDKLKIDKLTDAKFLYFMVMENKVKTSDYAYKVTNINIQDNYKIKEGKITIDSDLIATMESQLLNRTKEVSVSDYKLYFDNNLTSNNQVECDVGIHKIKVEFNYNDNQYEFVKEIEIKEEFGGLSDQEILNKAQDLFSKANQTLKDIMYGSGSTNQPHIMVDDLTGKVRTDDNANSGNSTIYVVLDKVNNQKVNSKLEIESAFYSLFDKNYKMPNVYTIDNKLCTQFKFGYDGLDNIKAESIKSKSNNLISFKVKAGYLNSLISFEAKLIYKNNQWKVYEFYKY